MLDFKEAEDNAVAVTSAQLNANHSDLIRDTQLPCQQIITQFLHAGCSSWFPTNSVKALKAR